MLPTSEFGLPFTTQQGTEIVELYFENQHSSVLAKRTYQRESNLRNLPSELIIRRLTGRFQ